MKTLITNYVFNASAKTITFLENYVLEQVLLITNVTDGIIIYNFSNPAMGGTLTNGVLTLEYDTSAMSNTDSLQIYIDTTESELASAMNEIVRLLSLMRNDGGMADSAGRVRINVESGTLPTVTTVSTVTTCSTCSAVSNVVSAGGYQLTGATFAQMNNSPKFNRRYITVT
jgi:hypothetical protein